jgi:ectoine hydroxylase-related dioxygenase (phytanoyl-CoA dioxygenase family)
MDSKGFNTSYSFPYYRDDRRVQDLWSHAESVKALASHPKVLEVLQMLYDKEPIPFQTLNFRVGSQQRAHSDTIHFSSIPARFMCGVWVALEDITPDNGAVFYYPGSHRMPEYNFSHFKSSVEATSYDDYTSYEDFMEKVMEHAGIEKMPFYAKKGDALIWSSNIIHGGSKVNDPNSTRYSQVTHYYFKDCVYYTPMLSNMVTNELYIRDGLVNIGTGEKVKMTFNGSGISYVKSSGHRFILTQPENQVNRIISMLKDAFFKKRNV